MSCNEDDCECSCHDGYAGWFNAGREFASIIDAIDVYFQPATRYTQYIDEHDKLLSKCLESIENEIEGQRGDPGKLYPLHERVRRVIGALQARAKR